MHFSQTRDRVGYANRWISIEIDRKVSNFIDCIDIYRKKSKRYYSMTSQMRQSWVCKSMIFVRNRSTTSNCIDWRRFLSMKFCIGFLRNIELYRLTSIFIDDTFQWFPCLGIFNVIVVVFIIVRSDSVKNSSLIDSGS